LSVLFSLEITNTEMSLQEVEVRCILSAKSSPELQGGYELGEFKWPKTRTVSEKKVGVNVYLCDKDGNNNKKKSNRRAGGRVWLETTE
jgi:hypothetical protein